MSRWGNATPKDLSEPVSVFSRVPIKDFQHGGLFYSFPRGASSVDPHLAERLVAKHHGDVFFGTADPNVIREPEPVEEPSASETVEPEVEPVEVEPEPAEEAEVSLEEIE